MPAVIDAAAMLNAVGSPAKLDSAPQNADPIANEPNALIVCSATARERTHGGALDCVAVVSNYNLMNPELISRLHAAGLRALCYTVNDPAEAQRLQGAGIDGLITDAVDRFSPGPAIEG